MNYTTIPALCQAEKTDRYEIPVSIAQFGVCVYQKCKIALKNKKFEIELHKFRLKAAESMQIFENMRPVYIKRKR